MRRILCLVTVLAFVSGCGTVANPPSDEAGSPQRQARAIGAGYVRLVRAFAAGRGAEACAVLTPRARQVASVNAVGTPMSCPDLVRETRRLMTPEIGEVAETIHIDDVQVNGDQATVDWSATVRQKPWSDVVVARRVGGRWLYDAVQLAPSG